MRKRANLGQITIPVYQKNSTYKKPQKTNCSILNYNYKNRYIASATPLTGISVVGEDQAITALCKKVIALLNGPFSAVVLKTTYLDTTNQWKNVFWPAIQVQSHMRSRCLFPATGSPTLWNTGRTALEMLPPCSLNKLLKELENCLKSNGDNQTSRVIISLGSKFPNADVLKPGFQKKVRSGIKIIWGELFNQVFEDISTESFLLVEINVRHFLREIVKCYLGGDEYLNPANIKGNNLIDTDSLWREFKIWLQALHDVAVDHKKKLILKLPHRSDTLAYVKCIMSLRELHISTCNSENSSYGVRGITLVNALKTPMPIPKKPIKYTPAWYADPKSWGDAHNKIFKHQMSGSFVAPYRNQILAGIIPSLNKLSELGIQIFLSGGITSKNELESCKNLLGENITCEGEEGKRKVSGIQIGTWGLMATDLGKKKWSSMSEPEGPAQPIYVKYKVDVSACNIKCCTDTDKPCMRGALIKEEGKQIQLVNENLCWDCSSWECLDNCKSEVLKKIPIMNTDRISPSPGKSKNVDAILPRISFIETMKCMACGRCQKTFYCDSFLDRLHLELPPLMDSRNCSGCGLCVQVCKTGALQLYEPSEMLVLLSTSEEPHEILRQLNIPFLAYHPVNDISNFGVLQSMDGFNGIADSLRDDKTIEGEALCNFVNILWSQRLGQGEEKKDEYLLGKGKEKTYPDERENRQDVCIETAGELIEKYNNTSEAAHKTALIRAIIWSQLIWSDPGQVLWDSFILTAQTFLEKDGVFLSVSISDNIDFTELKDKTLRISSYVVLLRQGKALLAEKLEGKVFYLKKNKDADWKKYNEMKFGKGRLAGIDARACGHFLIDNFSAEFAEVDRQAMTGLPWEAISQKIADKDDKKLSQAFAELCGAVKKRTPDSQ